MNSVYTCIMPVSRLSPFSLPDGQLKPDKKAFFRKRCCVMGAQFGPALTVQC